MLDCGLSGGTTGEIFATVNFIDKRCCQKLENQMRCTISFITANGLFGGRGSGLSKGKVLEILKIIVKTEIRHQ